MRSSSRRKLKREPAVRERYRDFVVQKFGTVKKTEISSDDEANDFYTLQNKPSKKKHLSRSSNRYQRSK